MKKILLLRLSSVLLFSSSFISSVFGQTPVISNPSGCTPPSIIITSNSPVALNRTIALSAKATNAIAGDFFSYRWLGSNGFASTSQEVKINNVTFAQQGIYTVFITNIRTSCVGSATASVQIVNCISPKLIATSNSPVLVGKLIELKASLANYSPIDELSSSDFLYYNSYKWSSPNGFTSTTQQASIPNATTTMQGVYTVQVTDIKTTCSATTTVSVQVVSCLNPKILARSNGTVTEGNRIRLYTSNLIPTDTLNYSWTGVGGFTSTLQNVVINNAAKFQDGWYSVQATKKGTTCTATASTSIKIVPCVIPTITATSNTPVVVGKAIILSSNIENSKLEDIDYKWSGVGGFTSTTERAIIFNATLDKQGVYSIAVTNGLTSCSASATVSVQVIPCIIPKIIAESNGVVAIGKIIRLSSKVENDNLIDSPISFKWVGVSGFTSTSQRITMLNATVAQQGIYSITATNGTSTCTASATTSVQIIPCIIPKLTAENNGPVVLGKTIALVAKVENDNLIDEKISFKWSGVLGFTSTTQKVAMLKSTATQQGIYSVTATNGTSTCTASATTSVQVVACITPKLSVANNGPVTIGKEIILSSKIENDNLIDMPIRFKWSGVNGFTSTTQRVSMLKATVAQQGIYSVTVTNGTSTCTASATTSVQVISVNSRVTSAIIEVQDTETIQAESYPNPAQEYIFVRVRLSEPSNLSLSLINANGIEINNWQSPIIQRIHEKEIDISKYPAGIYFITATANDKQIVKKILKD